MGVPAAGVPQAGATAAGPAAGTAEAAPPPVDLDAIKQRASLLPFSSRCSQQPRNLTCEREWITRPQSSSRLLLLKSKREKMEFARAMACLGKLNSPEMRRARTAELTEMATIKGKTIEELEREITETQEELSKTQADLLFMKHDVQLADEKITIYLDKLQRLEVKLARLRSEEERGEGEGNRRQMHEEEMEEYEERETGRKYSGSSRSRQKEQKAKAAQPKPKKTKTKGTPAVRTYTPTTPKQTNQLSLVPQHGIQPKKRASTPNKKSKSKPRFTEVEGATAAEGQQQLQQQQQQPQQQQPQQQQPQQQQPQQQRPQQQQPQQQQQHPATREQLQQQMEYQHYLQQMQLQMQRLQQQQRDEKIKHIPPARQDPASWWTRPRRGTA
ncbi:tropomyosin 1 alpha chain, putative [Eimeria mitis]|uniref:Tropomyosin 1 alpha chain, putative n=1 Tax=Eimeria mitis TaxID=44415 RepID=U6JQD6_9EIME|nr:tropomyosin 1 alpha chain, putative [Eimeria mitis]CDJ27710.1 tropomyosin 1 alpha chain, putative [Eimeria mitis]